MVGNILSRKGGLVHGWKISLGYEFTSQIFFFFWEKFAEALIDLHTVSLLKRPHAGSLLVGWNVSQCFELG